MTNKRYMTRKALPKRSALAVALAVGMGISGFAFGQATTGTIFGNAPQQSGETVMVKSATGLTREVPVTNGQYSVGHLPVGTYTVTLRKNGEVVSARNNITISVGAGRQVSFAGGNVQKLNTIEVSANALPVIDVSTPAQSLTLTSTQLQKLPLGQSADSIALLAPGATAGSNYFGGISVGGAGITENAYYVNGYNTTALYNAEGYAYTLPYGAIAQQQTITGGFSAKYGRADGGVINQIGKRGTNQWHFGARVQWVPRSLRASPVTTYYPDVTLYPYKTKPGHEQFTDTSKSPGQLYRYRGDNKGWDETLSAYVGGPLIKDKLFFFLAAQTDRQNNRSISSVNSQRDTYYKNHSVNYYGKLDWNVNANNILEYTFLKSNRKDGYGYAYHYNYDNFTSGSLIGPNAYTTSDYKTQIFHYTGYLSDAATLSVIYGKTNVDDTSADPAGNPLPYIAGAGAQDPAITGGNRILNDQTLTRVSSDESGASSNGLRVDFSYQLGDHLLMAGIDNMHYYANGRGIRTSGPGYLWIYGFQPVSSDSINDTLGVGAPGGNGYYVQQYKIDQVSKMSARQQAWYIQDNWQITPNLLLNIGLRNDSFTNYNSDGVAFVAQDNQWEPRLGFSWDINGDGSFKIYGSVGRYYLALPQAVANRQATASLFTHEYFTYTGINPATGEPTGLKPVPGVDENGNPTAPPGPVSANGEFGTAPDPQTVASLTLKPQYQDEIIVGFDKKLGDSWVYGASAKYRTLGTLIDDGCYPAAINQGLKNEGLDPANYDVEHSNCHLFNPNLTNKYKIKGNAGVDPAIVTVTQEMTGLPEAQRDYYALNLYLQHPFDGTWFGRIDYVFSRSWGNAEGQVRSDIGQGDIAATEDWDYAQLMVGSRGYLANDIRHQLKAYGAWQITPEWMLSGTLTVESGRVVSCLGFYGPTPEDAATRDPGSGYGSDYHWCEGKISTPGSERTPWTKQLDLGITYSPAFADHRLAFKAYVFNVLDEQKPTQLLVHRFARHSRSVNNLFHSPYSYESPRYVRLTVSYDY